MYKQDHDPRRRVDWLDLSAIGLSGLCLLHCLAGSLVVAALSAVSLAVPAAHDLHLGALVIVVPLTVVALGRTLTRHRYVLPSAIGAVGLALMILAVLPALRGSAEVVLTVSGVTLLAVAHTLNMRHLRYCPA